MNTSRRDFIKHAAVLGGAAAMAGWPASIRRAMASEPAPGSTFLDAEHVVILMQENRSFDHTFGTLRGVRGFGDPRAMTLPGGLPVWAQPDAKGRRFVPFRMDIKRTKATWMGSLPHSWTNQVDALNGGRNDRWLEVKDSGQPEYAEMPLTLGYYAREDIPFYYALADAFTVCDQNFCSTLTGTTPNRLHLWTGTIRASQTRDSKANLLNSDVDYWKWADWPTFPERLEDLGISWKTYQNEISLPSGLSGEHHAWLANFEDNPLEWFTQYGVLFAANRRRFVQRRLSEIPGEIKTRQEQLGGASSVAADKLREAIDGLKGEMARLSQEAVEFTQERFEALSDRSRRMHERAFTNNASNPEYRELMELAYHDGQTERRMMVPKADPLHQFRKDVEEGKLPTVSWLVPSERFSDHPSSAWYGAWYLSETLDILTKNPDVWRKTVFILTYDENDGYFDHVPPFAAPDPRRPATGQVSGGIDASLEYVTLEQDKGWHPGESRESAMGLGFRVPMVIASPWSRGGAVCSQVFDHTSVLQFLELVLSRKTSQRVRETNINQWRRAVCGDLSSAFREADDRPAGLTPLNGQEFLPQIHKAQFQDAPRDFRPLTEEEIAGLRRTAHRSSAMPRQESGTRPSCPLPYELFVSGGLIAGGSRVRLHLEARNAMFKHRAAGAAFIVYPFSGDEQLPCRNYALEPGTQLEDAWDLSDFADGMYRLRVYGPNGSFWELRGDRHDPAVHVSLAGPRLGAESADAEVIVEIEGSTGALRVTVSDLAYAHSAVEQDVAGGARVRMAMSTSNSSRWFDLSVRLSGVPGFERRFAGRLETGAWGTSDPQIGV